MLFDFQKRLSRARERFRDEPFRGTVVGEKRLDLAASGALVLFPATTRIGVAILVADAFVCREV